MAEVGRPHRHANDQARWRETKRNQRRRAAGLQPNGPVPTVQMGALQVPCVRIGTCTLYLGDALQLAPLLQGINAVILDPPYGTAYDVTKARRSNNPLQGMPTAEWDHAVMGDDTPFDPKPWLQYKQIILWGANHYCLPAAHGWITWDKRGTSKPDDHAGTDLAWTNIPGSSRVHTQLWRGRLRAGEDNGARSQKLHPHQKPIELMQLCVRLTTGTVLDPYMGSGTTGVACLRQQRPFIGIDIDPHYFDIACHRLAAAAQQLQLFPAS
jgi:site-specific DNA-methyltransferase (adenine-specific)